MQGMSLKKHVLSSGKEKCGVFSALTNSLVGVPSSRNCNQQRKFNQAKKFLFLQLKKYVQYNSFILSAEHKINAVCIYCPFIDGNLNASLLFPQFLVKYMLYSATPHPLSISNHSHNKNVYATVFLCTCCLIIYSILVIELY